MNKKGFTLIELLAVIVILAIIALIVTPIISNIITKAKRGANARSVESHIKNVEIAMMNDVFKNGTSLSVFDNGDISSLTILNDNISCDTYTIVSGTVMGATGCTDRVAHWDEGFCYNRKNGAYASDDCSSNTVYDASNITLEGSYGEGIVTLEDALDDLRTKLGN